MLGGIEFSKLEVTWIFSQRFTQHARAYSFTLSLDNFLLTFLNSFINNKSCSLGLLLSNLFRLNCKERIDINLQSPFKVVMRTPFPGDLHELLFSFPGERILGLNQSIFTTPHSLD